MSDKLKVGILGATESTIYGKNRASKKMSKDFRRIFR